MNRLFRDAVIRTLCYADIFEYPLTYQEIKKWLIEFRITNDYPLNKLRGIASSSRATPSMSRGSRGIFQRWKIPRLIHYRGFGRNDDSGFYFLSGRENIVKIRLAREKWSEIKIKIAEKTANILRLIPTVKLVGITGALAMDNAKEDDDIDLFIITSKGLLWTTRFVITLMLEFTGRRRRPQEKKVNNKICLNMLVTEDCLTVPKKDQDLFSAHEVLQMNPVFDSENTYKKFIIANQWVRKFLPNAFGIIIKKLEIEKLTDSKRNGPTFSNYLITQLLNCLERSLRYFQLLYMKKRRTTEVISDSLLRFHPHDARNWVLKKFSLRYRKALNPPFKIPI